MNTSLDAAVPASTGEVIHSDSKNSISSSSYESASEALSETEIPTRLVNGPVEATQPSQQPPAALEDDFEDDGHHSDGCFSNTNSGPPDTTSPEMTNSTNDSSYHTYPYVSIMRRYASALDLSKPIELEDGTKVPANSAAGSGPMVPTSNANEVAANLSEVASGNNEVLQQYLTSKFDFFLFGSVFKFNLWLYDFKN